MFSKTLDHLKRKKTTPKTSNNEVSRKSYLQWFVSFWTRFYLISRSRDVLGKNSMEVVDGVPSHPLVLCNFIYLMDLVVLTPKYRSRRNIELVFSWLITIIIKHSLWLFDLEKRRRDYYVRHERCKKLTRRKLRLCWNPRNTCNCHHKVFFKNNWYGPFHVVVLFEVNYLCPVVFFFSYFFLSPLPHCNTLLLNTTFFIRFIEFQFWVQRCTSCFCISPQLLGDALKVYGHYKSCKVGVVRISIKPARYDEIKSNSISQFYCDFNW